MSPLHFKRLSDESLGSRLASGEAAAFDELYRRYVNRLAAYGAHLLGDAASGDDVAQATLLKAYSALREGRIPDRMKPWLFRIAHNTAIDLVVRRRELPSGDLPETPSVDREPFAGALVEALATLPDRQRRVYILREVHGLRIDETAAELGLNTSQVEQSLFAARNRLAEQLVFGDRLNCVTVQRLAAGPLDAPERRALKTHLRMCNECRESIGARGRALALFPGTGAFEWLRGLGAGLIGGGAPVAAKVGAIFATATVVGGGTVAVEQTARHHAHRPALRIAAVAPVLQRSAPTSRSASAVETASLVPLHSGPILTRHARSSRSGEHGAGGGGERHGGVTQADGRRGAGGSAGSGSDDPGESSRGSGSSGSASSGNRSSSGGSGDGGSSHGGAATSGHHGTSETSTTQAAHQGGDSTRSVDGSGSGGDGLTSADGSSGKGSSDSGSSGSGSSGIGSSGSGSSGSDGHSGDDSDDSSPAPTTTSTTAAAVSAPPPVPATGG